MSRRTYGSANRWPGILPRNPVTPDPAEVRLRTRATGPAERPLT